MSSPKKDTPQHIAIIMDGNGRWAKSRLLPRVAGHRAGMKRIKPVVRYCSDNKVPCLSLFAFSTENWTRPKKEVSTLMGLLIQYLKSDLAEMHGENVRIRFIGRISELPANVIKAIDNAMELTAGNTGLNLTFCVNYSGRSELVDAAGRLLAARAKEGDFERRVDEKELAGFMYSPDLPDPDLMVRTSGEYRISNYYLWQMAYTELWTTSRLWPDFYGR